MFSALGMVVVIGAYALADKDVRIYAAGSISLAFGLFSMALGGIDVARGRRTDGPAVGGQAGWQGGNGNPQAAFRPAGAVRPAGVPMSAQPMPGAGAQVGMGVQGGWGPATGMRPAMGREPAMGRRPAVGGGGSDYAGYGAASTANPANWYPDPQNPAMLRWWDGQGWTSHTRPYN